jgi:uncharacterized membrane protein
MAHPKPMALWAGLIAGFMVLGLASLFVGLVVLFLLVGRASWRLPRCGAGGGSELSRRSRLYLPRP